MAAVVPIRELDTVLDSKTIEAMRRFSDVQVGWFWNIFLKLRVAPDFKLPFDDQFWSLTGARTKGYWLTQSAPVLACFERQSIAGQTWIWHSGLVRLAEAVSQFGNQPANEPEKSGKLTKKQRDSIKDLFLKSYTNYRKHIEPESSEEAFYKAAHKVSKQKKIPLVDAAEFIAAKVDEYSAATIKAGIHKQFIPYMGKWLRKGRYDDDPSEWVVSYELKGKEKVSKLQRNFDALKDA